MATDNGTIIHPDIKPIIIPNFAVSSRLTGLKPSGWQCELFGTGKALVIRPMVGHVPNAWWRFWQRVILGNKWTRIK